MTDELLPIADRPMYYRALAAVLRARVPFLQSAESRQEIAALAADYETLASYLDANLELNRPRPA